MNVKDLGQFLENLLICTHISTDISCIDMFIGFSTKMLLRNLVSVI